MLEESSEKRGFVYILINPAFAGFVKVGKTTKEPEVRARELSAGSGVPAPYAVAWDALVTDCDRVEKLIHQQLAHVRSRNDREFFAIPLKNAITIASSIVAPFTCVGDEAVTCNRIMFSKANANLATVITGRNQRSRMQQEEIIEVAEDYKGQFAQEPPDCTPKTISRIEYELLIANPYKFTERELFHEVHVVQRNKPHLKINSYNIKRCLLVQSLGWGIHRNRDGKLALVVPESEQYKELQGSVKRSKSYRKSKL